MESNTMPTLTLSQRTAGAMLIPLVAIAGCAAPRPAAPDWPDVRPAAQVASDQVLELDPSVVTPMYQELFRVDLSAVVELARMDNLDIAQAREQVELMKGRYQSAVGAAFPVIAPTALFEHVEGTVRATEGNLVGVGFNTFQPSIVVEWIINPGQVIYNIIAAKKRMWATEQREQAVIIEILRTAVSQYYDLILAQSQIAAAQQSVAESQELLRITQIRSQIGTGVPADDLRAQASLAERRQVMARALNTFYQASVALTLTLRLDATVTLVPNAEKIEPTELVRSDLDIEELLELAVVFRPDLASVRTLAEAAADDRGATWWGALGVGLGASYQYGGITGQANNVVGGQGVPSNLVLNPFSPTGSFSGNPLTNGLIKEGLLRGSRRADGKRDQTYNFTDQQRASARAGWRFSMSMFGDLKSASASQRQAALEAQRQLDQVRAQVVRAAQASQTNRELIGLASQQVVAAVEALRLTQANLQAGTMTTLDVLQAQDAASQARLSYAEAVVHYNQSQVDLLAALGLVDEEGLALQVVAAENAEEAGGES